MLNVSSVEGNRITSVRIDYILPNEFTFKIIVAEYLHNEK